MFCKISVLKKFAKFIRKHLCRSLVSNKVAGWKLSQKLQQNSYGGVSFLIAASWKPSQKITRKLLLWWSLNFNKVTDWKNSPNSQDRVADWRHNITIKLLIHLHFFMVPLITKPKLFAPLIQHGLTHNWQNLWKTAFKKFEVTWSELPFSSVHIFSDWLKVFGQGLVYFQ